MACTTPVPADWPCNYHTRAVTVLAVQRMPGNIYCVPEGIDGSLSPIVPWCTITADHLRRTVTNTHNQPIKQGFITN